MHGKLQRFLIHTLGGIDPEEIPKARTSRIPGKITELSAIAVFDSDSPLTDMETNQRVKKDLAIQIATEMVKNGVIRYSSEWTASDGYLIRASAKVIIPEEDWW